MLKKNMPIQNGAVQIEKAMADIAIEVSDVPTRPAYKNKQMKYV